MTHDYKRNGAACLFAALNVLAGKVIGSCYSRHRHQEFLKFLRRIDLETPKGQDLHLIVDNYGAHTHPKVKRWLNGHTRFYLHFTPTSSSWLNLIERWFAELTRKRIRRRVFKSVPDLVAAIQEFINLHNQSPKPFVWHRKTEESVKKTPRRKAIMETLH
jgi:transposase